MAAESATVTGRIIAEGVARQRWTFTGTLVYWMLIALCGGVWSLAAAAWLYQVYFGLHVTGLTHPVMWATYITAFVFWIGIAHSGTLMSAILFLFRARWRIAIARLAETMTLAAIMTALLFPIIHLGRAWRAYWLIPYPNERGLWINFSSPLVWDAAAIGTYFIVSILFWFIHLIPDFATLRDRADRDWPRRIYRWLACGWQASAHEWAALRSAYAVLAGLIAVLVVSVHSIVSWDFAVGIVPGWHSTIFAPYFVAGAMLSGLAMLLLLLIPGRELLRLETRITADHLDNVARLIVALSLVITYSYITEFAFASRAAAAHAQFLFRVAGTYAPLFWLTIACNSVAPLVLFNGRARRNTNALLLIAVAIIAGMWLERFVIIVSSLAHEYNGYSWGAYRPSYIEATIAIGSLAWFLFWFLLIAGHIPPISIAEQAEEAAKSDQSSGAPVAPIAVGSHRASRSTQAHAGLGAVPLIAAGFASADQLKAAITSVRSAGAHVITAWLPAHDAGVIDTLGIRQHIGAIAFGGGVLGAVAGMWFTSWTTVQWPSLIVSGKPLVSWPTFVIVAFELTILAAALAATAAFAVHLWRARRFVRVDSVSRDRREGVARTDVTRQNASTLLVASPPDRAGDVTQRLREHGAETWIVQ